MLPKIILVFFMCIYGLKADCLVPNEICFGKTLNASKTLCKVNCVSHENCLDVSYLQENKDNNSSVILSAEASLTSKYVSFKANLQDANWKMFKINVYSYDVKASLCRTYMNDGPDVPKTDFEFVIFDEDKYEKLENKEIYFEYEITSKDVDKKPVFGKFIFTAPKYKRFAKPPAFNMELFNYIDITEEKILKLNIQQAEKNYKIPTYDVEIWKSKDTRAEKHTVPLNRTVVDDELLYIVYNATEKKGIYHFVIIPNTTACGKLLFKTKSAVVDLYPEYTLTAIILYSVILVLLVFGGTYLCFRRECAQCQCRG